MRRCVGGFVIAVLCLLAWIAPLAAQQSVDGVLGVNEYPAVRSLASGRFLFAWRVEGEFVYFYISAETTGWVAVGIDPIVVMDNADMLMAMVVDGEVVVRDARSLGPYGPFVPDERLGGTNDILEAAGTERDGRTVVELKRRLRTDDPNDHPFKPEGGNKIVWAYGPHEDFSSRYQEFGIAYTRRRK